MLRKAGNKFVASCLALLMVFSLFGPTVAAAAENDTNEGGVGGYVTIAVEKFTLGQGYIAEPVRVPFQEGDNAAKVILELLGEGGYRHTGNVESGFYLASVYDPGAEEVVIPDYILQAIGGPDQIGDRKEADWLTEKDYTSYSGWMFAVDDVFANVGASEVPVEDGDVIRWQYTVYGLGEDLGRGSLIDPANKDALTEKVAVINSSADKADILADAAVQSAYDNAYAVLGDMESEQSAVDEALADLLEALVESEELNTSELEAAIHGAEADQTSVQISADGSDVNAKQFWVQQADLDALSTAILSARELLAVEAATQDEVDAKALALNQARTAFLDAKKPGLRVIPEYNATFTVAPKAVKLELYDADNKLVDIGSGTEGTYNVYTASLPAGDYAYSGVDAGGNSVGGGKLTVTTAPNQAFDFRQLNLKASNSGWTAGSDYTARIGQNSPSDTSLTLGTITAAGQYPALVLAGQTYFYQLDPTEARIGEGYMELSNSVTVTLGGSAQAVNGAIPLARIVTFAVPEGAELFVGRKIKHFVSFEKVEPLETTIQDGKQSSRYKLMNNSDYNYRVSQEGKLTNAGMFKANDANAAMEITEEQLNALAPNSILNRGTYLEGNIYLNINEQNHLKLAAPGDEFQLLTLRSWQALIEGINNYFFEPDFHYEIIAGRDVIDIDEGAPGSYSTIRAKENGTAIVKVTYDALKVNGSTYTGANDAFSAIWPENAGLFVVTVGQEETGIVTGIESNKARNQKANEGKTGNQIMNLQNGAFDADIDSVYYIDSEPGAIFTFKPTAGSEVSVLRPTIDHAAGTASYGDGGFSTENVTAGTDGSFSVLLTEGRNIVKIEKDGLAEYQVMTARPLDVTVDNVTRPGEEASPGDRVKVTFAGLSFPANKLSGIYNFNAQLNFLGGPNQTPIAGLSRQYNIATQANSVEFQVPADLTGRYALKDGHLKLGFFGSPIGDHRNIDPKVGANPNFTALTREGYYGIFPEIVIVKGADKAELELTVQEADAHLKSASVSTDGKDVLQGLYWVTQQAHDDYAQFIESALALIADETATQDEVDAKVLALEQAYDSFEQAKQPGLRKEAVNLAEELNKHLAYLVGKVASPAFGTSGGEWSVLALARAGYEVPEGYYDGYYRRVIQEVDKLMTNGKLHPSKGTEHARLILALTSIGKDIYNVDGYDISAALADLSYVSTQGINGPIFALIALDSHGYDVPERDGVADPTTREKLIDAILAKEIEGGGWSLFGKADPDITAMTLQALAPYYEENEAVKLAADRAVLWLSAAQNEFGGYVTLGTENVQSVAQVVIALTALGIDPHTDPRFNKNGRSAIDNLLTFAGPTGGFVHPKGKSVNAIATDQGTHALIAYSRYAGGETSLFDMSDVVIKKTEPDIAVQLPQDGQPIVIPNDGNGYTIRVREADKDKQISIELSDVAETKTYINLPAGTELPKLTVSRGDVEVELPAGLEMNGDSSRKLELITSRNKGDETLKNKLIGVIDSSKQVDAVHEYFAIGGDEAVQFSNGFVAITFKGMKGKEAAFIHDGQLAAIQKFASDQAGLDSGKNEYAYENGNDLIVKTNHFTDFAVYSVKDKPVDGGGTTPTSTIQLSVDKLTIGKGYVLSPATVEFTQGETAWDVLKRELDKRSIAYLYSFSSEYNSVYVESIAGDGEFDHGEGSGWNYKVNGVCPNYGASAYTLKQGDIVEWRYTTQLGEDVGCKLPGGGDGPGQGGNNPGGGDGEGEGGGEGEGEPGTGHPEKPKSLADFYSDSADVSSWASELILEATQKGFIEGFGRKVDPKREMTRAEFAKLIVEIFDVPAGGEAVLPFRDVQAASWFHPYVNAAYGAGIVTGYGEQFLPNHTITREEMAVMIARALKRETAANGSGADYRDRALIAPWALEQVADLAELSIMTGYDNLFDPKGTATREMAIVVAMRAYQYVESKQK